MEEEITLDVLARMVAEGFVAVENRIGNLEDGLHSVHQRLDSLENEVRATNQRIDSVILPTLDDHARRIKDLELTQQ